MTVHLLRKELELPLPLDDVFDFFNRPENLAKITPPQMGFQIMSPLPVLMAHGTVIDYLVRIFGIPARWTSIIQHYQPPYQFVDCQLKGPYAFWHHTHLFQETRRGTLITDEVRYMMPFGIIGSLIHRLFVRRQLEFIFQYREKVVRNFFLPMQTRLSTKTPGEKTMKIVLTGVTGFIGKPLVEELLKSGHNLYVLTRDPALLPWSTSERMHTLQWDAEKQGGWAKAVDGADAVINLAGEPIADKRWIPAQKEKLLRSRVNATRAIADAIRAAKIKPKVLINASAVGYYGSVESGEVPETAARGQGFLAEVCEAWERETHGLSDLGVRVVLLRIGIVLEKGGGAFAKMELPFKMFAGGPLGSGQQWFPWIHRDDILGLIEYALGNHAVSGPLNASAPQPVTMGEFCSTLGRVMGRPSWAPVPAFALKLLLGEMSEMLLTGQKAVPQKALEAGYVFKYPDLEGALNAILKS